MPGFKMLAVGLLLVAGVSGALQPVDPALRADRGPADNVFVFPSMKMDILSLVRLV